MGKIHARTYRRRLRQAGWINGWFAILEGITIAEAVKNISDEIKTASQQRRLFK